MKVKFPKRGKTKKTIIMKLKIKTQKFVDWHLNSGSDQEQEQIRQELGNLVTCSLLLNERFTIAPRDLLDNLNTDVIPMHLVEGFQDKDTSIEIGDLDIDNYKIQLI